VVLGYPENGPYTAVPARVRGASTVRGSDIYGNGSVIRTIYSIRAVVRSGNSGGPLLAYNGRVLGMVFATALDSPDTGFALTNQEIRGGARQGSARVTATSTGRCVSD
jgi:S1-C subfamily serine protease